MIQPTFLILGLLAIGQASLQARADGPPSKVQKLLQSTCDTDEAFFRIGREGQER